MTTPNDIDVMLHYYASPTIHPRADAPAVREATEMFVREGLLEPEGSHHYNATDKGAAWISMLLRVPFPRVAWADDSGAEVLRHNAALVSMA